MRERTIPVLIAVLAATVGAAVTAEGQAPSGTWADAHCAVDAVRERFRRATVQASAALRDETTFEGLFALASMERECKAAAAESAKPEPELVGDRAWTSFCSVPGLRRRHTSVNPNGVLMLDLFGECRDALQAAADAKQDLRRCRYRSVSDCGPTGCVDRPSAPAPAERWLEVPVPGFALYSAGYLAEMGDGPWPTVRRCDVRGCDRISVYVDWGGAYFTLKQRNGPWFAKVMDLRTAVTLTPDRRRSLGLPAEGDTPFIEVATLGLNALVYYGSCPGA